MFMWPHTVLIKYQLRIWVNYSYFLPSRDTIDSVGKKSTPFFPTTSFLPALTECLNHSSLNLPTTSRQNRQARTGPDVRKTLLNYVNLNMCSTKFKVPHFFSDFVNNKCYNWVKICEDVGGVLTGFAWACTPSKHNTKGTHWDTKSNLNGNQQLTSFFLWYSWRILLMRSRS